LTAVWIALILFAASLVQALTGFGLAMVGMPLLVALIGVRTATPLVAVLSIFVQIPMLIRYRHEVDWRSVLRLGVSVMVGVPLGVLALKRVDPAIVSTLLGVVVVAYALYALIAPELPRLVWRGWAIPFGFVAGLLSGAYSTGGPPLIIYGDASRWEREAFKGNLQAVFMMAGVVQIASHALVGNLTPTVGRDLLVGLPGIALGIPVGLALDKVVNPALFRKIVLGMLVLLGLNLIF